MGVVLLLSVLVVLFIVLGLVAWQARSPVTVQLPGGVALQFLGMSHGGKIPAHLVGESSVVDWDGCQWEHKFVPPSNWKQTVYGSSPTSLRKYLPKSWRPPAPSGGLTTSSAEMMLWNSSTNTDLKDLWFTWVDKNGFESTGHADQLWPAGKTSAMRYTEALPPSHSPNVILRIRQHTKNKPLSAWPLIAELPMRNPNLMTTVSDPPETMPVTRTAEGLALTLQSLTVDPDAVNGQPVSLYLKLPPNEKPDDWEAQFDFFNQRHTSAGSRTIWYHDDPGGILLTTTACLWTDAPWLVRVSLRPRRDLPPRISSELRFTGVPLPSTSKIKEGVFTGVLHGWPITLVDFRSGTLDGKGRWLVAFLRPELPHGCNLSVVSVTDDLGGKWTAAGDRNDQYQWVGKGKKQLKTEFVLTGAPSPGAKTVDVVVGVDFPLVYDFYVMPEFKGSAKPAPSKP